jgi:hypothetical protein
MTRTAEVIAMASVAMSRPAAPPSDVVLSRSERPRVGWWYVAGALVALAIPLIGAGAALRDLVRSHPFVAVRPADQANIEER